MMPARFMRRHIHGALDAFRRELESPREDQRERKSQGKEEHYEPHRPDRNFEERENLGRDLNQDPADDGISDRDAVNVPSLQFPQESAPVHLDWL
jgi:hypothetical protein